MGTKGWERVLYTRGPSMCYTKRSKLKDSQFIEKLGITEAMIGNDDNHRGHYYSINATGLISFVVC
jgi:hypothetical protein